MPNTFVLNDYRLSTCLILSECHQEGAYSVFFNTPSMDQTERFRLMLERISTIKEINDIRKKATLLGLEPRIYETLNQHLAARWAHLPPLPSRLPRPEYCVVPDVISQDDDEIRFYVACELGLLDEVDAFMQQNRPSQAVRQYALEQASFGNQPAVAKYLLEHGTSLHGNVFGRGFLVQYEEFAYIRDDAIFDEYQPEINLLALLNVFLAFGWHPNQAWSRGQYDEGRTPLPYEGCLANRQLVKLLLEHGADPNIGAESHRQEGNPPMNRQGGDALNSAARLGDVVLVDLLLAHGADPAFTAPLHSIVSCQIAMPEHLRHKFTFTGVPFARRRPMAEHLLASGAFCVNDVRKVPCLDTVAIQPRSKFETTVFAHCCAAQDWEFAEWVLEKGADPGLLNGKAFWGECYSYPHIGPTDPETVKELVRRVTARRLANDSDEDC